MITICQDVSNLEINGKIHNKRQKYKINYKKTFLKINP